MASYHKEFLAQYGTQDNHKKMLNSGSGRSALSRYPQHHAEIAKKLFSEYDKYGKYKEHDDPEDVYAARNIISRGTKEHRDIIAQTYLPDRHENVAADMAEYGTNDQRDHLVDHPSHYVRSRLAAYGDDSHREKLLNDKHVYVVRAIAGSDKLSLKHAKILANHEDPSISKEAVKTVHRTMLGTLSQNELKDLQNHDNPSMRNIATRELNDRQKLDKFLDDHKDDPLLKV